MSFKTQKLPNENIIIHTLNADFNPAIEVQNSNLSANRTLNEADEPCFFIIDLTALHPGLDEIMLSANAVRQNAVFANPRIRELIFATRDDVVAQATKGFDSAAFGHVKSKVFTSLEKALAYARSQQSD